MNPIRFLKAEHVYLSPAMSSDVELFIRSMNDETARMFARSRRDVMNDLNSKDMMERLLKHDEAFVVRSASDDAGIGYALILDRDQLNREAMLSITLGEEKNRGKGYGTEAMILLLEHAFINLNLESVYLGVYEYNKRAIKLYDKLGFKLVGRRRHSRIIGSRIYDEFIMDMISDEYFQMYGNTALENLSL
jgi:RimJ/RimL family protein N-acetyltransferase